MNIHISKEAQKWFQYEMMMKKGDHVRFFVRYGGSSPIQDGFSLGVSKDEPIEAVVTQEIEGIIFYIEERDLWYFDGHDLHVDYSDKADGPTYDYSKNEQ
ncbi:HesB/YadR/YfhF family protein [Jeotgalibacillus marinus]|uniref:HesB/YadR/YfhF family protein n=1 Tax=Jeotgalibacillus marinus TaxID=86667 RepID=A0ABV3Q5D4_9BACL